MEHLPTKTILAVVTTQPERITGGGAPVFIVEDQEALQKRIFLFENILDAMAHELDEDTYILVRH